jgi:aspartyl/asparaginyl beta-hydroxylase (cupin superfamily)
MAKDKNLDPDTIALLEWCEAVEAAMVARGAPRKDAQQHIEEQAEWFTDQFYEGLTPEQAAAEAMHD